MNDPIELAYQQHWHMHVHVLTDPAYLAEKVIVDRENALNGFDAIEPFMRERSAANPSAPHAYIPPWVKFSKRQKQDFTCPVTKLREGEWYLNTTNNTYHRVGRLTYDHVLAKSKGGLSTEENSRMLLGHINSKKRAAVFTDEQMANNFWKNHIKFTPDPELLKVLNRYNITEYKVKP